MPVSTFIFQSTLPARGVTKMEYQQFYDPDISIHTPREGSDPEGRIKYYAPSISIHTPREGSDFRL